jgi:putative sterol carrier protein
VTGAPVGGDVRYVVRVSGGRLAVSSGEADAPDVTITLDHPTAVGVATGDLSLHDALVAGRVKIKGDPARLLGASGALAGITAVLGDLRATTSYR